MDEAMRPSSEAQAYWLASQNKPNIFDVQIQYFKETTSF